jgi:hypothetical protein
VCAWTAGSVSGTVAGARCYLKRCRRLTRTSSMSVPGNQRLSGETDAAKRCDLIVRKQWAVSKHRGGRRCVGDTGGRMDKGSTMRDIDV